MRKTKLHFLVSTILTFSMVQAVDLGFSDRNLNTFLQPDREAYAKSSAGRSGGGSFTKSAPSSSSSSSSSKSSSSSSSTSTSKPSSSTPSQSSDRDSFNSSQQPSSNGNTIIAPVPIIINNDSPRSNYQPYNSYQSTTTYSSSRGLPWFVWLIILVVIFLIVYLIIRAIFFRSKKVTSGDLGNDTFTISKLQVALLAQAREVQSRLTELSLEVDTDTQEGLMTLMQESALALIRTPENWMYVSTSSQSVHSNKAEELFNKLSLEERSKFSEETLVNVSGRSVKQKSAIASPDKDPSAYIVVTLLVGTEHDKPLFGEIRNTQELQKALEAIASIPSSYLLAFELLWTPQADSDSLSYDDLLTEYTNMIQI